MSAAGCEVVYTGKWHLSKPIGDTWSPADLAQSGFDRWHRDSGGNHDVSGVIRTADHGEMGLAHQMQQKNFKSTR